MAKNQKSKKIQNREIIIAALITASIGCIGTVVAATIGYLGIRAQVDTPIQATKTAQAIYTSSTVNSSSTNHDDLDVNLWLEPTFGCIPGPIKILPDDINPSIDFGNARNIIQDATQNGNFQDWALGPYSSVPLSIRSKIEEGSWIRFSNTFQVTITPITTLQPKESNAIMGYGSCGGGSIKKFEPIKLVNSFDEYSQNISHSYYDYFTLQPGEEEILSLSFICDSPGVYKFSVLIPYTYLNDSYALTIDDTPSVICPDSYILWLMDGNWLYEQDAEKFIWNGYDYDKKP